MIFKGAIQAIFFVFIFTAVLGFIILGSQFLLSQNKISALSDVEQGTQNAQQTVTSQDFPARNWQVRDLNISATSGISIETNLVDADKSLFAKNGDIQLPIASLSKLMTAIVALDNYNLQENITLDKNADLESPVVDDLKLGDTLPVEEFLQIMLIESSNKAAFQLAEKMGEQQFVGLMNQKAKDIGLENTFFAEPTGLSNKNVSTAKDLAKLAEYILKNYPKIADISRIQEIDLPNFQKITNTNQLLGCTQGIVCGKTGFTTDAKGCLLLVVNNPQANDYLIYVILGSPNTTSDNRFSEMKTIIDWTNSAYKW